jgi:PAS domain S-box-containing protein
MRNNFHMISSHIQARLERVCFLPRHQTDSRHLEELVSKLFTALKDAADGAFVVDEKLHIVYWNDTAEKILKFDLDYIADQYCYQVISGYDEQNRLICKKCCEVAELALKSEPVSNYDFRMQTKLGSKGWLNMSIFTYPMDVHGGNKVIVHLFRDINDRKENEIFLRRLLEVAQQYVSMKFSLSWLKVTVRET